MLNMEVDLIIKFGGSAITDKNIFETIKSHELSIAAQCIKTCTDHGLKCIVVHGAGSFGHHHAKQYEVNTGLTDLKTKEDSSLKVRGYCLTRQSVTKLNQIVVNSLLQSGVPAVACSPGSSWITSDREPLHSPCEVIAGFVNTGLVPVLHGDCSLDDKLGCCILSGDTVIKTLCSKLTVKKVIFLTDVAGIYDRPPDQPGAQLIKSIKVNPNGEISSSIAASQSAHDVTGGILLKLKTAINIIVHAEGKCCVYIMGINSSDVKERFINLLNHIHFDYNNTRSVHQACDIFAPVTVKDICELYLRNLTWYFVSGEIISVDEQQVGFRSQCIQYMSSQPDNVLVM